MSRSPHRPLRGRVWIVPALLAVLGVGHGAILYYVSSHIMFSTAVASGVIFLLVVKHVGLLGPLVALFRRRPKGGPP